MLKLTVHNIGPIASAEIEIGDGITLVGAVNEAGKSTLLASAAGALTGNALFLPAITAKKDAGLMLRDGAKSGRAALASADGDIVMVYPAATVESHGAPPSARPNAVGRAPFLGFSEKDRAKVLSAMLHAEPGADELAAALRADGLGDDDVADILEILKGHGWDGGFDFVSKRWTEEKGAWQQITKSNYGAAKAAAWNPHEWTPDLETLMPEQLEAAEAEAKTALDHARANQAVDEAEIARLTELAETLRDRKTVHDELAVAAQKVAGDLIAAEQERAAMPATEPDQGEPCPHCSQPVIARLKHPGKGYTLHKADQVDGKELEARRMKAASIDGTIARLTGERATANKKVLEAAAAVTEAENAGKRLAEQKKGKKGDHAADGSSVQTAETRYHIAAQRVSIKRCKMAADEKHAAIAQLEKVRAHFQADGLRQVKLANALTAFCEGPLRELSDAAGWPAVVIRPDMSVTSGGHIIMSKSAQWRAETLLAVAFARLGGSQLVILDEADVNDAERREGLIALLEHTGLKALIGMTLSGRDRVPDLAAAGLGRSYWIENGTAHRIGAEQKAAA